MNPQSRLSPSEVVLSSWLKWEIEIRATDVAMSAKVRADLAENLMINDKINKKSYFSGHLYN